MEGRWTLATNLRSGGRRPAGEGGLSFRDQRGGRGEELGEIRRGTPGFPWKGHEVKLRRAARGRGRGGGG